MLPIPKLRPESKSECHEAQVRPYKYAIGEQYCEME